MRTLTMFAVLAVASVALGQQASVFHDPWLNWDFLNLTGQQVDDFHIVVESGTFDPGNQVLLGAPFTSFNVSHGDYDNDGDLDTVLSWSGGLPVPPPPGVAHIGAYMKDSGRILDAYWTFGGLKVGPSIAISYELTEIRPVATPPAGAPGPVDEVHMQLQIAPGYFNDPTHPNAEAGWTEIRTFVNIPADLLGLSDLNRDLDLTALLSHEVEPKRADGTPILPSEIIWGDPDSFFDVFLATIPPECVGPQYESLLVARVVNAGDPIGMFWNLNPQSPEPATLALLGLGLGGLVLRRMRRK